MLKTKFVIKLKPVILMAKGGKRVGAGRRPEPDKKLQIPVYVRSSIITKFGRDKIREVFYSVLEELS